MSHPTALFSHKAGFFYLFLACLCLLSTGIFLEYYYQIIPCPLCVTQRVCYLLITLIAFVAYLFSKPRHYYLKSYILLMIPACVGAALAIRQIWLQHLPKDQVPACGPDLSYIIAEFPMVDVITAMFVGDGNCAEEVWSFLGLNIAEWSLVSFITITIFCLYQIIRKPAAIELDRCH